MFPKFYLYLYMSVDWLESITHCRNKGIRKGVGLRREDGEFRFGVGRSEIPELRRNIGAVAVGVRFTLIEV